MSAANEQYAGPDGTALSRLIACPAEEFADEYWGRLHLLTRTAELPSTFEDLFGADAVDALLSTRGIRLPFVRMVRQGDELPADDFTRSGGMGALAPDQVADDMALVAMSEGASLMFEGVQRFWAPITEFTTRFSAELGHPVRSNAHITPPHARGLPPHYDYHDVFVVQISGRKRWQLYEPVVEAPLFRDRPVPAAVRARPQEREPLLDTILEPGDVLYVPRGVVHCAATEDETSIHISIGIPPVTRYDLVSRFLEQIKDNPGLRAALPMGVDLADPSVLAGQLETTIDLLRAELDRVRLDAVAADVTATLIDRTRPEPIGPLQQLALARKLDGSTKLRARIGIRLQRTDSADEIRLTRHRRYVTFPPRVAEALDHALSGAVFTPVDLPGLDLGDQFAFANRLVTEGFVVGVED